MLSCLFVCVLIWLPHTPINLLSTFLNAGKTLEITLEILLIFKVCQLFFPLSLSLIVNYRLRICNPSHIHTHTYIEREPHPRDWDQEFMHEFQTFV